MTAAARAAAITPGRKRSSPRLSASTRGQADSMAPARTVVRQPCSLDRVSARWLPRRRTDYSEPSLTLGAPRAGRKRASAVNQGETRNPLPTPVH